MVQTTRLHDSNKELHCLVTNIYHEARGESMEGQLAVALVTKNRLSIYTRTLCDVVYAKKQFSWTSKISRTKHDNTSWNQAEQVAKIAMTYTFNFKATHYHSKKIKPNWKLKRVAVIGNHVFYK